jgi:uncharacterized membrane protein
VQERADRAVFGCALVAAVVWIAALGAAPLVRTDREAWSPAWRASAGLVYLTGSYICHQRSERSFHLAGAPLPVCARCIGLHVGAAFGIAAGLLTAAAWPRRISRQARRWLVLTALPTLLSVGLEALGAPSPLWLRTLVALPFGVCASALTALAVADALRRRGVPEAPQPSATLR